jgi:hypothetical protein
MRCSLRGVLARVDRIGAAVRQRAERLDPAELVAILQRRFEHRRKGLPDSAPQPMSGEEARDRGRRLREMLRDEHRAACRENRA